MQSIELREQRESRARMIAQTSSLMAARQAGLISRKVELTLSEALVLGLLEQGVRTFYTVFGHGSTEIGEVLRIYQAAGLVRVFGLRSEIEASHSAVGNQYRVWFRPLKVIPRGSHIPHDHIAIAQVLEFIGYGSLVYLFDSGNNFLHRYHIRQSCHFLDTVDHLWGETGGCWRGSNSRFYR